MINKKLFWLRLLALALGCAATVNGIVLSFTTNFNLGNILTLILGAAFLCLAIFFDKIKKIFPIWLKAALIFILVCVLGLGSFLFIYGVSDNVSYNEDAVIVLGAAIHKDVPSLVLKQRLDKAAEYHNENPNAIIVVSGGKGPQESITEALAMERYLISKGVPTDKIIKEEKATSTYENFIFSKEILDEHFSGDYNVAFVTNEYHTYRAGEIAALAGLDSVCHIHSNTRWYSVLPGVLRECVAVAKHWVFGQ